VPMCVTCLPIRRFVAKKLKKTSPAVTCFNPHKLWLTTIRANLVTFPPIDRQAH
jgi:hypothetical protein